MIDGDLRVVFVELDTTLGYDLCLLRILDVGRSHVVLTHVGWFVYLPIIALLLI